MFTLAMVRIDQKSKVELSTATVSVCGCVYMNTPTHRTQSEHTCDFVIYYYQLRECYSYLTASHRHFTSTMHELAKLGYNVQLTIDSW